VDLRTSAGLEGYRRNLGDELDTVKKKLLSGMPDARLSGAGLATGSRPSSGKTYLP
jgi:hypothetical protein